MTHNSITCAPYKWSKTNKAGSNVVNGNAPMAAACIGKPEIVVLFPEA